MFIAIATKTSSVFIFPHTHNNGKKLQFAFNDENSSSFFSVIAAAAASLPSVFCVHLMEINRSSKLGQATLYAAIIIIIIRKN